MAQHRPSSADELSELIGSAAAEGRKLELRGGGSKAKVGQADRDADLVDMTGFSALIDYDPAELVFTAGAGMPLAEAMALVAAQGQMLPFEPFDHGPVFGTPAGAATLGGVVAAGVSGSRRISAGGVRDHLLGFKAVSGRGEAFTAGARVVKNVTGYDLPKLLCNSWGRLAALTEVTFKVLPAPLEVVTLVFRDRSIPDAVNLMLAAMRSQASVAAAAHIPSNGTSRPPLTLLRLEGFGPSVQARLAIFDAWRGEIGANALWDSLRTVSPLADETLWRVSLPPRRCADFLAAAGSESAIRCLIDWAGGLVWLAGSMPAERVRNAARATGGHAMLVRGPAGVPTFQPQPSALASLEERVRRAFDPSGVFEAGRF